MRTCSYSLHHFVNRAISGRRAIRMATKKGCEVMESTVTTLLLLHDSDVYSKRQPRKGKG
ncbi:hypothetical protein KIN20_021220 [Parelaphostrongylus tenuis]|uniref:Uncharacterized protein n=1 Tax=Parelaphostrongylus tenuis TaxID=148309 RepID=A0AAD5QW15_PARTN|nr:hypothetical protein KIN20_021220 [Parelaphostrongylus tenuis]